jgi:hypothetical protein
MSAVASKVRKRSFEFPQDIERPATVFGARSYDV